VLKGKKDMAKKRIRKEDSIILGELSLRRERALAMNDQGEEKKSWQTRLTSRRKREIAT